MVSIIVATYNGQKYLLAQLISIAKQSYKNIEIIICDDASNDSTVEIIKEFAKSQANVSYFINETNIGVNKNFELGFLKAKGNFIAIADQDDIWLPNKIEEQMKLFIKDEILLTHTASALFRGNNLPTKSYQKITNPFQGNDVQKLLLRNSVSGHNIIFRKQLLQQIFPIPKNIYYDWWIVQTAACNGYIAASNKVLTYQRAHENNVTVKVRASKNQTEEEYQERIQALQNFLQLKNLTNTNKIFIEKTLQQFSTLVNNNFSKSLFRFLLDNRKVFFYYKKGILKYFSQKKAAKHLSNKT